MGIYLYSLMSMEDFLNFPEQAQDYNIATCRISIAMLIDVLYKILGTYAGFHEVMVVLQHVLLPWFQQKL